MSTQPCSHSHGHDEKSVHLKVEEEIASDFRNMVTFLEEQFGKVDANEEDHKITVDVDGVKATIDSIKFVSILLPSIPMSILCTNYKTIR